jgi:hypothetical protein
MADIQLEANQAALILESSDDGEISVNIALPKDGAEDGVLASAICRVIAEKLVGDLGFQDQVMSALDGE